ncbi:retrotransposon protein, putative, ty1-copia subclass [Tanacetum coccineum]
MLKEVFERLKSVDAIDFYQSGIEKLLNEEIARYHLHSHLQILMGSKKQFLLCEALWKEFVNTDLIVIGTTIVAAGFYSLMWGQAKEKNKLLARMEEDLVVGHEPVLSDQNTPLLSSLDESKCDLSYNNLTGTVPQFLASLDNLKLLNLTGTNFTIPLPAELLAKLKKGSLFLSIEVTGDQDKGLNMPKPNNGRHRFAFSSPSRSRTPLHEEVGVLLAYQGTKVINRDIGLAIQKANKKSLNAKGKNKVNGKGKDKKVYIPKPNNPKPTAKERPAKDDTCHHCKEVGHWKRNCPVYLAELQKKMSMSNYYATSSNDNITLPGVTTMLPVDEDGLKDKSKELSSSLCKSTAQKGEKALYDAHTEIACLMLGSMTPELHRQFELHYPYDMIQELRSMFEKQAGVEKFDLIQSFHACKQEEGKSVADYVLKMKGYVEQLERLGYMLPQDISVGLILNGLTKDFVGFVRNYNMHNMGKTIGEIHAMLIEYEKGLPKKAETPQVKGKGKDKKDYIPKPKNPKPTAMERPAKDDACHHCKEVGHWKRNCPVYLAELLKKKKQVGSASSSGIFTIELFSFPNNNSWVYDTGCGTNICITKQGFRIERKLKQGALYLYVGNGVRAQVEAIGSFDLVLPNGLVICLDNCHYAPTITRGVVSVSRLVDNGFVQCFTDYGISVSKNGVLYFNVVSRNGIYEIDMHDLAPNVNSIYNVSNKRVKRNLDSTFLWHCRLAHINKKRIKQLQQDGLLKSMDDESFDKCESCLSGKMTKKPFLHSNERAKDLLGIIHTDVCGPLRHVSRQGASYFITFTDDYSRYGYVYLLKHKHEVFETFKVFKNEVENQLGKTIKAIRSDRGGEYISQEFKDYLKANGIVQQLTPPYTPQHNGVFERRNRTLLDMVRSMMNLTTLPLSFWDYALHAFSIWFQLRRLTKHHMNCALPLSFWDYALESATCILNMVPTKRDTPDKLEQRSERISKSKRAKTSQNRQEMKRQVIKRKDIKAGSARQKEKVKKVKSIKTQLKSKDQ